MKVVAFYWPVVIGLIKGAGVTGAQACVIIGVAIFLTVFVLFFLLKEDSEEVEPESKGCRTLFGLRVNRRCEIAPQEHGMTHAEFAEWLKSTCKKAPNHTVGLREWVGGYIYCIYTDEFILRFNFRKGVGYGIFTDAREYVERPDWEEHRVSQRVEKDRIVSKKYLTSYKDSLKREVRDARTSRWLEELQRERNIKGITEADIQLFQLKAIDDLEYLIARVDELCQCLFGVPAEYDKGN